MKKALIYLYFNITLFSIPISLEKEISHSKSLAIKYLLNQQNLNGSWGPYGGIPAYTALVMRSLLQEPHGKKTYKNILLKSIAYLKQNMDSDFAIVNPGKKTYKNYTTSVSIVAFYLFNKKKYSSLIKKMRSSLINNQFDQNSGIESGGIGYGSNQKKSDLSNTQYALEALYLTESVETETIHTPKYKKLWQDSITFIKNSQIHKDNPYPWIDISDKNEIGGFLYSPDRSMVKNKKLRSYGSMTYAAIKSMIFARLTPKDKRVKAALEWITRRYTVKENPNLGQEGYFYYINTMAKTLRIINKKTLTDKKGNQFHWAEDICRILIHKQSPDGYWKNPIGRWQENSPILSTTYALMSLQYASNQGIFYEKFR